MPFAGQAQYWRGGAGRLARPGRGNRRWPSLAERNARRPACRSRDEHSLRDRAIDIAACRLADPDVDRMRRDASHLRVIFAHPWAVPGQLVGAWRQPELELELADSVDGVGETL